MWNKPLITPGLRLLVRPGSVLGRTTQVSFTANFCYPVILSTKHRNFCHSWYSILSLTGLWSAQCWLNSLWDLAFICDAKLKVIKIWNTFVCKVCNKIFEFVWFDSNTLIKIPGLNLLLRPQHKLQIYFWYSILSLTGIWSAHCWLNSLWDFAFICDASNEVFNFLVTNVTNILNLSKICNTLVCKVCNQTFVFVWLDSMIPGLNLLLRPQHKLQIYFWYSILSLTGIWSAHCWLNSLWDSAFSCDAKLKVLQTH